MAWAAAFTAVVMALPLEAAAEDPRPGIELGYDGLLMAGEDVTFEDSLHGGSIGVLVYMTKKNPILMRIRANVQGAGWTDLSGKKGKRLVSGMKWSVGLGIGRGRLVLPFVEVGFGPQFLTIYHDGSKKVADWAWTIGLEGQLGFIFRIKKAFGIRLGAGFTSLSFYSREENLGGFWITASLLLGIPGPGYHEPTYHEPPPPPPSHQPSYASSFYFDGWITDASSDGSKPVLNAKLYRDADFDVEVSMWVELADGSAYEMNRSSLEDPDLYELPLYILGLACGGQSVQVMGKSGFMERSHAVHAYLPCPVQPEGM
ncbi:MAG: hypothetical protein JRG91_02630 [Deltaproteobacteria bacterium]|nr:hypothetical protein [Deltaproteobacteria bacterium]